LAFPDEVQHHRCDSIHRGEWQRRLATLNGCETNGRDGISTSCRNTSGDAGVHLARFFVKGAAEMKRAFERFMGRLLAGRHAGDENLLARAPGLAEVAATIELTSPAFGAGAPIPKRYTQEGDDRFPPLTWRGVPAAAQELVIVVEDPDAPLPRPVVHAIIHGLSARAEGLDEAEVNAPGFAGFGRNSRGARNYRGPRPILGHGPHRYVFQLFALQQPMRLAEPPTKKALRAALSGGGVLARGELVGTYERS